MVTRPQKDKKINAPKERGDYSQMSIDTTVGQHQDFNAAVRKNGRKQREVINQLMEIYIQHPNMLEEMAEMQRLNANLEKNVIDLRRDNQNLETAKSQGFLQFIDDAPISAFRDAKELIVFFEKASGLLDENVLEVLRHRSGKADYVTVAVVSHHEVTHDRHGFIFVMDNDIYSDVQEVRLVYRDMEWQGTALIGSVTNAISLRDKDMIAEDHVVVRATQSYPPHRAKDLRLVFSRKSPYGSNAEFPLLAAVGGHSLTPICLNLPAGKTWPWFLERSVELARRRDAARKADGANPD